MQMWDELGLNLVTKQALFWLLHIKLLWGKHLKLEGLSH